MSPTFELLKQEGVLLLAITHLEQRARNRGENEFASRLSELRVDSLKVGHGHLEELEQADPHAVLEIALSAIQSAIDHLATIEAPSEWLSITLAAKRSQLERIKRLR